MNYREAQTLNTSCEQMGVMLNCREDRMSPQPSESYILLTDRLTLLTVEAPVYNSHVTLSVGRDLWRPSYVS